MAKKGGKKTRRSRSKNINLLNVAQGIVAGNILTQGMFGLNAMEFLRGTPNTVMNQSPGSSYMTGGRPTYTTTYSGIATGANKVSLMELFGASGNDSGPEGAGKRVLENIQANWLPMTTGLIMTRVGFRIGKRFARPALTPVRQLLKGSGVTV